MKHVCRKNKSLAYGHLMTSLITLLIIILFSGHVRAEGDDALFIDEKGNVGIGTTSPGATLDVAGDGASTKLRLSETAGGGNEDIIGTIDFFEGHYKHVSIAKIQGVRDPGANDGRIVFLTTLNGEQSEKMRINSNGNVGIGTSSPKAKLDVDGRISRKGQEFSKAGTANHGATVSVPWGTTSDWNIFVSPNEMGRLEPGSEGDNALLQIKCFAKTVSGKAWKIIAQYSYRVARDNRKTDTYNGTANYILIPK